MAGALPADEASAHPGLLARLPDHRAINFRCVGSGRPTVLLEGGYAATSLAWTKVQALIAPRHRACAYDRAGIGFSDPGPLPRDGAAIASDLDLALRAARIPGPYIVVGHSAGGLYVRLFADRRPREVVGMVLVDPSVEYQDRRFAAVFGPGAGSLAPLRTRAEGCLAAAEAGSLPSSDAALAPCTPAPKAGQPAAVAAARLAEAKRPATWKTQISELDSLWTSTSDEVAAGRRRYGDLPLVVLTAEGTYAGAPAATQARAFALWADLHAEIAARSNWGSHRVVAGSSHLMMRDRPDAVAAAIEEVSRRQGGTRR
ncbi:MAG TPA: alpha/beta hydrolase [Caulobacteraceae bacterium]|nr:alpha/beta hydrolase [Caulobacteraceae bacterium]